MFGPKDGHYEVFNINTLVNFKHYLGAPAVYLINLENA